MPHSNHPPSPTSTSLLFQPLTLKRGPPLKHRLLLAPLTDQQSNKDGTASPSDLTWLTRCAAGNYALIMTCAAHIHPHGQSFPNQLGIHNDTHLPGLRKIASIINSTGTLSSVQLHHGGARATKYAGGTPVGPSPIPAILCPALTLAEVQTLRDDFVAAALRAQEAGFHGVEVHAAFGWILMQFLSPAINHRTDRYGGNLENRSRLLFEVIDGIRDACNADFQIGLRISMERFGVPLTEVQSVCARALAEENIDYLDLALWDYQKITYEAPFAGRMLLSLFTELPRGNVRVGASGKIFSARQAVEVLEAGCDFVMVGRAAILELDFPRLVQGNGGYCSPQTPVSGELLRGNGLGERFVDYMRCYEGFVRD